MDTTLVIRRLIPAESLQYREIRLECLRAHPDAFFSQYDTECEKPVLRYEECIANASSRHFTIGAFLAGQLVGICSVDVNEETLVASLMQMYVRRVYSGQGIGEKLLRATMLETSSVGTHSFAISVFAHNQRALALYRRAGFEEIAREATHCGLCIQLRMDAIQ